MFVCGGLTTCCSVCSGVVIVARKRCSRAGRHLANALRSPPPARLRRRRGRRRRPGRPPAGRPGRPAAPPTVMPAFCRQVCIAANSAAVGRRDLPVDLDLLAARLDLRDDLRHRPRLVHGGEHEAARDRCDAVDLRDLGGGRLRERELRAGQEEVVDELVAGLAELREVGDHRLVRLDHLAAAAAEATAAGPAALRRVLRLRRERHGEVGADAGERVQRLRLRLVEPAREGRHGDHERDADRQAEHREDRAALAPHELAPQIAEEEHPQAIEAAAPESHLGVARAAEARRARAPPPPRPRRPTTSPRSPRSGRDRPTPSSTPRATSGRRTPSPGSTASGRRSPSCRGTRARAVPSCPAPRTGDRRAPGRRLRNARRS